MFVTQIRNSFNNEMESYAIALTKAKVREEYKFEFVTRTTSDEIIPFIFFFSFCVNVSFLSACDSLFLIFLSLGLMLLLRTCS